MTKCEELIINETTRGKGVLGDPVRRVVQIFSKDGKLLAEKDSCMLTGKDAIDFANYYAKDGNKVKYNHLGEWMEKTQSIRIKLTQNNK